MKRLSDADIERYAQNADKWGLRNESGYYQAIQVELQLRILDKLNERPTMINKVFKDDPK